MFSPTLGFWSGALESAPLPRRRGIRLPEIASLGRVRCGRIVPEVDSAVELDYESPGIAVAAEDDRDRLAVPVRVAVGTVLNMLALGDYDVLEAMTHRRHLSAEQLRSGVEEYGRHLSMPPRSHLDDIYVLQIQEDPSAFHVVAEVWTQEEGRSDLSIILQLVEWNPNALNVEIIDLLVP